jgi:NDP-sugar pyrophosphorylase family protein
MKALVLAAGLGTRLGPMTLDKPKSTLPVGGRPLIECLVRWLSQHGITEIAVNLHHCPEAITQCLGTGAELGVRLTYSYEPTLLGTAGAAKNLEQFLDVPFVVVYGDGYTNLDLSRLCRLHDARRRTGQPHITMALFRVPNPTACGLVDLDDERRVTRFVEKPAPEDVFTDLANAGVLIIDPALLELIPKGEVSDFGRNILPLALERGIRIYGEPLHVDEYLIDIGTPDSYARACQHAESVSLLAAY